MTPAAALFDLDGCLVDSFPSILGCWRATLPEFGYPPPTESELRPFVGPPVDHVARHLAPDAGEDVVQAIIAAYRRCSVTASGEIGTFPGIPELLARLVGRGVRLAVATSKSIEVVEPTLDHLGLRAAFAVVEGTRRDELGTDKATIVGRTLHRLGPATVAGMAGDRAHDVRGAHAHGLTAYGVLWGYGSEAELRAAGADALAREPAQLGDLLSLPG